MPVIPTIVTIFSVMFKVICKTDVEMFEKSEMRENDRRREWLLIVILT